MAMCEGRPLPRTIIIEATEMVGPIPTGVVAWKLAPYGDTRVSELGMDTLI